MKEASSAARVAALAAAAVAFLVPFSFAVRGTDWNTAMHPDEISVRRSMDTFMEELHPDVDGSVYPEGFFVLANLYRKLTGPGLWMGRLASQEGEKFRDLDKIRAPVRKRPEPSIAVGRRTNAVLAGLCGLFLFFAVRAATGSAAGGLCAAFLAACSPFVVEHAHYCESDLSFCAGLGLSLWFLFAALRKRSPAWTAAAAAACAGAFACKYTVAPLVPFCIAVHLAVWIGIWHEAEGAAARRRTLGRFALASLGCLAAAAAAYVLFTPLVYADSSLYWEKIFRIYGNVQFETATRDLSPADDVPFLRARYVLRLLMLQVRAFGPVHLALFAVSAVFLLFRRGNSLGRWLIALVVMFFAFDVACAPWIRSQEFLPFAILAGTAVALAAGMLDASASLSRFPAVRAAVPAACLAACGLLAFGDANRVSRMFSSEDCRNTMRHWLEMASNPATRFAAGRFASPALRYGRITTAEIFGDAEGRWRPGVVDPADPGHEYYVRQSFLPGRGFVSNATGQLHPEFLEGWKNFTAHAVWLRNWKSVPGYQPTFCQLPVELWGIVPPDAEWVRPEPFAARATAYRMGPEPYDAAQGGDWLGPVDAVRTVGKRASVRFVPPSGGAPLYAVTRHVHGLGPALVKWEGCFKPRKKQIEPGRADWFRYEPGPLDGFGDMCVRTRVRMRGDDQTSLCLTTVTADPAFAAELLVRGGSPDKAAELLADAGLPADAAEAVSTSAPPLPSRFFRDFARIRFGDFTVYPGPDAHADDAPEAADGDAPDAGDGLRFDDPDAAPAKPVSQTGSVRLDSEFPVMFDPGLYRVSFFVPRRENGQPAVESIGFSDAAECRVAEGSDFRPGERTVIEVRFDKAVNPRILGVSVPADGDFEAATLRDFRIEWDPFSRPDPSRDPD